MDRRRSRRLLNRGQTGIRCRSRAGDHQRGEPHPRGFNRQCPVSVNGDQLAPMHRTGCWRFAFCEVVFHVPHEATILAAAPAVHRCSPTYRQRTRSAVTGCASNHRHLSAHRHSLRLLRASLTLGALGVWLPFSSPLTFGERLSLTRVLVPPLLVLCVSPVWVGRCAPSVRRL